jgi:DAACS family dicarboxylate/amino acid:cation (Na+ or H+) symporter
MRISLPLQMVTGVVVGAAVALTGENPFAAVKRIAEPLILAFTTRSSEVTLPIHAVHVPVAA